MDPEYSFIAFSWDDGVLRTMEARVLEPGHLVLILDGDEDDPADHATYPAWVENPTRQYLEHAWRRGTRDAVPPTIISKELAGD